MALTNYGELKTALGTFLTRVDLDQQSPDFVTLGLSTLNKVLRHRRMIANADIAIAGGTRKGVVPTDMLEPIYCQVKTDEDYPLEHVDVDRLIMLRQSMLRDQGTPRFFAILGTAIEVVATPASSTTLDLVYYQSIPAFTNDASTNWLLTHEPDLMLYAALLHAAPLLKDEDRLAVFSNVLTKQLITALQTNGRVTLDNSGAATIAALSPPAAQ